MSFLKKWFRKQKQNGHNKTLSQELAVRLTDQELILLKWWTDKQGVNIDQWAREALLERIPAQVKRQVANSKSSTRVMTYAMALLDEDVDEEELRYPEPPASQPSPYKDAPRDDLHSCTHLRKVYPHRLTANHCLGTCASPNPSAQGRICHWPASSARECPYFEPQYARVR